MLSSRWSWDIAAMSCHVMSFVIDFMACEIQDRFPVYGFDGIDWI